MGTADADVATVALEGSGAMTAPAMLTATAAEEYILHIPSDICLTIKEHSAM